jgi:hypothetical protein
MKKPNNLTPFMLEDSFSKERAVFCRGSLN